MEALRAIGLGGKSAAAGAIGAIPDTLFLAANSPTYLANYLGNMNAEAPFEYITPKLLKYGIQPETENEKLIEKAGEFAGGLRGFAGSAAKNAPKAKDYLTAGASGAASEKAHQEFPESPIAPLLAALGVGAAPGLAKTAMNPVKGAQNTLASLAQVNPQKVQDFEKAALNPTLGDVSNSAATQGVQQRLRQTPFAGYVINNSIKKTYEDIEGLVSKGLTPAPAGELAKEGLRDWKSKSNVETAKLKAKTEQYLQPNSPIVAAESLQLIKNRPTSTNPEIQLRHDNSEVGKFYKDIEVVASRNEGALPYEDVLKIRDDLSDKISTFGMIGDKSQGELKQLRSSLNTDIKNAFNEKGPEAKKAVEDFNQHYTKFRDKLDGDVEKLISRKVGSKALDKNPVESFNSIVSDLSKTGNKAKIVMETLPVEGKEVFASSLMKELGSNNQNEFNAHQFATKFKGLNPEAQDVLMSNFSEPVKERFKSVINVIDNMKETGSQANFSNTANAAQVAGIGAAGYAAPATTAAFLGAANASARLFSSPKFINWLGKAESIKTPAEMAKHYEGLKTIAKGAPFLASDIANYLKDVEKAEVHQQEQYNADAFADMSTDEIKSLLAEPELTSEDVYQDPFSDMSTEEIKALLNSQ